MWFPGVIAPSSEAKATPAETEVGETRPVDADAEYVAERAQGDAAAGRVASYAIETATPEQGAEHFGVDDNGLAAR